MKDEAIEAEEFGVPGNCHRLAAVSTMCDISVERVGRGRYRHHLRFCPPLSTQQKHCR